MSAGKIVGGILALISGVLILGTVIYIVMDGGPILEPFILANLVLSILVIIGGILGLVGKKAGGILALIGGSVWLVGTLLAVLADITYFYAFSLLYFVIPVVIIYFGIIEIALAIAGGIVILASGE